MHESAFAEGADHLAPAFIPVFSHEFSKAGEGKCLPKIAKGAKRKGSLRVSFAVQREHSVRSGMNGAIDHAGEMNTQKWESRIGHGINQSADQVALRGNEFIVLS